MDVVDIHEGLEYKIDAPNTSHRENWTVVKIKENGEIEARGDKTPHVRTFVADQFVQLNGKTSTGRVKKMETASIEFIREMSTPGVEMWVEDLIYFPAHQRRGRKAS